MEQVTLRYGDGSNGLPVVEARLANPMLAAQIGCLHASLVFHQDRNDLLFRVPLALLVWSFLKARVLFVLDQFNGATSGSDHSAFRRSSSST